MAIFITICVLYFYYQPIDCQFREHIDLQKISEITFRDEKYNVLKPTIHIVRDHFKDVIQKRYNINFPTKRVFMDNNGFRHYWHGIEHVPNLRKNLQNSIDNKNKSGTVPPSKNTDIKGNAKAEVKRIGPKRKQPNRKKKVFERVFVANLPPRTLREGTGTLVKTTFFCPFFGTMTMMANVNLDAE